MYDWSTDKKRFKKENPEGYRLWKLTQLINYGLDGKRLDEEDIKTVWPRIRDRLDPYKARYLEFLLWGKQSLLPYNINFWNLPALNRK